MSTSRPSIDLRDHLADLLEVGEESVDVRGEISASWRRSALSGLRPEKFDVPHTEDIDLDSHLLRASAPVLAELRDDLSATGLGVVLTDEEGHVLERKVENASLRAHLDRILLAPGFVYAEDQVGTNAIGTALAEHGPSLVEGREHFADALTSMTCAAWPIVDRRSDRILGVVDLSCRADESSPLMLPLVRRAARDIEQRLVDELPIGDRLLLQEYSREQGRVPDGLVFINEQTMVANATAKRVVGADDHATLWNAALAMLAGAPGVPGVPRAPADREVLLSRGPAVLLSCRPVLDGGLIVGASLRLAAPSGRRPSAGSDQGARPRFGWDSLTDTEVRVVDVICQGLSNRRAAEALFMSPYTVDSHLRSIFRKLGVNSRVELTRVAIGRGGGHSVAHDT